jgi:hypothetical protein
LAGRPGAARRIGLPKIAGFGTFFGATPGKQAKNEMNFFVKVKFFRKAFLFCQVLTRILARTQPRRKSAGCSFVSIASSARFARLEQVDGAAQRGLGGVTPEQASAAMSFYHQRTQLKNEESKKTDTAEDDVVTVARQIAAESRCALKSILGPILGLF